ncbi:hypothetical protein STEG23_021135, partial [Scotinomys teguina]
HPYCYFTHIPPPYSPITLKVIRLESLGLSSLEERKDDLKLKSDEKLSALDFMPNKMKTMKSLGMSEPQPVWNRSCKHRLFSRHPKTQLTEECHLFPVTFILAVKKIETKTKHPFRRETPRPLHQFWVSKLLETSTAPKMVNIMKICTLEEKSVLSLHDFSFSAENVFQVYEKVNFEKPFPRMYPKDDCVLFTPQI